MIKHFVDAVMS